MKVHTTQSFPVLFTPAEEGGYTATVPALPGCISEGDSFEEAKKNITEAIELYLEVVPNDELPIYSSDYIVSPVTVCV
jgi:predicted RNase H-like HicB family nuclease